MQHKLDILNQVIPGKDKDTPAATLVTASTRLKDVEHGDSVVTKGFALKNPVYDHLILNNYYQAHASPVARSNVYPAYNLST